MSDDWDLFERGSLLKDDSMASEWFLWREIRTEVMRELLASFRIDVEVDHIVTSFSDFAVHFK